jgi:hypothetical protein
VKESLSQAERLTAILLLYFRAFRCGIIHMRVSSADQNRGALSGLFSSSKRSVGRTIGLGNFRSALLGQRGAFVSFLVSALFRRSFSSPTPSPCRLDLRNIGHEPILYLSISKPLPLRSSKAFPLPLGPQPSNGPLCTHGDSLYQE